MDVFSFIVAGIMVYIAIAVFIMGMIFRIISWFRVPKSSVRLGLFPKPKTRVGRFLKFLRIPFYFPNPTQLIRLHGSLLLSSMDHCL